MFKKLSISNKITLLVLLLTVVAVTMLTFISVKMGNHIVKDGYFKNLQVLADLQKAKLAIFFKSREKDLANIANLDLVKSITAPTTDAAGVDFDRTEIDLGGTETDVATIKTVPTNDNVDISYLLKINNLLAIHIIDASTSKVLKSVCTNDTLCQQEGSAAKFHDGNLINVGKTKFYISDIYKKNKKHYICYAHPVRSKTGEMTKCVVAVADAKAIFDIIGQEGGLGKTGEVILSKKYNNNTLIVNPLRSDSTLAGRYSIDANKNSEVAMQAAANLENGQGEDIDHRGKKVIAVWTFIPEMKAGLVVKIDEEEVLEPVTAFRNIFLLVGIVFFVLSVILVIIFARALTAPLIQLQSVINLLGRGVLPNQVEQTTTDEIGEMTGAVNNLVAGLKRTAEFAKQIGEGNFLAEFEPLSKDDNLGTALLTMRNNLQQAAQRDDERNWIVRGVAEISEILRKNDNVEQLSEEVIKFIISKVKAIQGAFYVVIKDDNSQEKPQILLTASYAYNKKKYLQRTFKFGEGLVGQAAIEQDTILRTEIPNDYVTITSGLLGEKKPTCLLIVPLINNEEVYGVIEMAGLKKFNALEVRFVQEISNIIAQTIFNIMVNERTRKLLEESQKMSAELQENQEELQQNAEEMAATQEELQRTNLELEKQIEEVNKAQQKMEMLLQNASEIITIYEPDMTVRYISPSVEFILGYSTDEMIGIKDISLVADESVKAYQKMFEDLLAAPNTKITVQFSYRKKDGEYTWLEAVGTNLMQDSAIAGLVVNYRDITERRRAEREARMRGQMQALSENSPDLITRLSKDKVFFYINPIIKDYTGLEPAVFLQKSIEDQTLHVQENGLLQAWKDIVDVALQNRKKIAEEINFNSIMGDRVAQINAIPEYNEEQEVESVLLVAHDITDRKLIELEIQNKNKKITESINYAKRIQQAILPDNQIIRELFPDSFIYYKPRDVVSGDFPWYMEKEDAVYIAAVDCTGHGVPGALISLIGYFLLNNIIETHDLSPAEVLDFLDISVTKTLKQDVGESTTRDGMDIAICKYNKKDNTLEFAGAHRPLYFLRNGELEEFKGDKFPIGGGQYKNRVNFTNHVIQLQKNDTVLFFSDGFPDQFGGADNRKFSPKRIREIFIANANKPMPEMSLAFHEAFEAWKDGGKQTDDVLMIGIRF
jgi:PAS domain S-box-containing protein